jgi:hypothetical protein
MGGDFSKFLRVERFLGYLQLKGSFGQNNSMIHAEFPD